jgi:hypothetical protein
MHKKQGFALAEAQAQGLGAIGAIERAVRAEKS